MYRKPCYHRRRDVYMRMQWMPVAMAMESMSNQPINLRLYIRRARTNSGDERRRHLLSEFLQNKLARRRAISDPQERLQNQGIREIPDDLLFKILILLPAESFITLQLVCKKWFDLINRSDFVAFHAQQSHTVLISNSLTLLEPFLALQLEGNSAKSYFHFLDLDNGSDNFIELSVDELVDIRASHDGLVLATMITESLVFMNPVRRKHVLLPLGTFVADPRRECYGIVFCNVARTYKVVHLFSEKQGETSCEILSVCTRKWARIEGQPSEFLRYVGKNLVSIGGFLHWVPRLHECDHFITLNVEQEKFAAKKLPTCCGFKDRLVEIGGSLGFVAQVGDLSFEVWIMGIDWGKRYTINVGGDVRYCVSVCGSRNGKEMVLEGPYGHFYAYDLDEDEMRLLHSEGDDDRTLVERVDRVYFPHRNTLISWEGSW